METSRTGIVYVLSNPAMPGIVKIGRTSLDSIEDRLKQLYSTGVPVPFECEYAGRVSDESAVENAIHRAFDPYRLDPRREFFEIDPGQAVEILRLIAREDVTPSVRAEAEKNIDIDTDARAATEKLKRTQRRPNMNFQEMGIPIGSTLQLSGRDESCTVVSRNKVKYNGEELSLAALTQRLLRLNYGVQGVRYWQYDGRMLIDIYNETYPSEDDSE